MDLQEFKKQQIKEQLGIRADFGTIHAFIDFANVNHWFEYDDQNVDGDPLPADQRLSIDLQKLHDFLGLFSGDIRFYYGHDPAKPGSIGFHRVSKYVFCHTYKDPYDVTCFIINHKEDIHSIHLGSVFDPTSKISALVTCGTIKNIPRINIITNNVVSFFECFIIL